MLGAQEGSRENRGKGGEKDEKSSTERLTCSAPRVCVLMLNSPNIPPYAHAATIVNYLYAAKHGYAMLVPRCPVASDLENPKRRQWMWGDGQDEYMLVWSKPATIEKYLRHFDYLMFVDSDAVVVNDAFKVEDFVERHFKKNTVMVWAEDCLHKTYCWQPGTGNTGVMVFKNTPGAFTLLRQWRSAAMCDPKKDPKKWKHQHTREQACLNEMLTKVNPKTGRPLYPHVRMVPYHVMNGSDGTWIQHYMGDPVPERIARVNKHLGKRLSELGQWLQKESRGLGGKEESKDNKDKQKKKGKDCRKDASLDITSNVYVAHVLLSIALVIMICVAVSVAFFSLR